jgi:uncharacterized protein YggT (Ycf19 family)
MPNVFEMAIRFVNLLVYALTAAIFLRALRRVLPSMGMLDLSPFVAMILLQVMGSIVTQTLLPLAR